MYVPRDPSGRGQSANFYCVYNEECRVMTDCEREGINGNCGLDCKVYLRGGCVDAEDMIRGALPRELKLHLKIYGKAERSRNAS